MCTAASCRVLGLTVPAGFTGSHCLGLPDNSRHCLGLPGTAGDFMTLSGPVFNCLGLPATAWYHSRLVGIASDCLTQPGTSQDQPFRAGSSRHGLALPWSGLGLTQAAARSMEKPALAGCFVVRGDWHRYLFCPKSVEDVSALKWWNV